MEKDINTVFRQLSRTEKTKFINSKIDYASEETVAEYVAAYIFDVLKYADLKQVADYLRGKGYTVTLNNEQRTGTN